jgi:hypothetical protein
MNELGEVRDGGTQTVQEGRLFFLTLASVEVFSPIAKQVKLGICT